MIEDTRNHLITHIVSVIAISFLVVFAWSTFKSRGTEYFWTALLLKGVFLLMIETILWSFVIRYSRGKISNVQQLIDFLVDQFIFAGLIMLLAFIGAHIKYQRFQVIDGLGVTAGAALFAFWMISKREK